MLEIHALSFKHQTHYLFENLNFQINHGELLQLMGANGSGKTTLLRILANLLKPSSGNIYYLNQSINENENLYQSAVAYLGHISPIKPSLTVEENLISHCILMGVNPSKIYEILEQLKLISMVNHLAYQLSQGQQRRLAFAKIVLSEKPIWILDEPLTALDTEGICEFNHLITQHLQSNGIVVMATHQSLNLNLISIKQLLL